MSAARAEMQDDISLLGPQELDIIEWRQKWLASCHKYQRIPEGDDWNLWLMLGGRGSGKTRCAAEYIAFEAVMNFGTRSLVAAATAADIRDTCFEGESGLLSVIPKSLIRDYNRSLSEIILKNGSLIKGIPASEPDRFRGGQWHRVWADELASWQYAEQAFDMIMFALRLGTRPIFLGTTTPRPISLIRKLMKEDGKKVRVVRASTYENIDNLAPPFRDQILQYEGTNLGRQEIHAEILDPEETGIIRRSWLRTWPAAFPLPRLEFIAMSLDTAFTEHSFDDKKKEADPTACSVWGIFYNKEDRRKDAILLDAWDDHLGLPDLVKRAKEEMTRRYGEYDVPIVQPMYGPKYSYATKSAKRPDVALIEDKGSGISLRQFLMREGLPTVKYNPGRASKLERLHIVSNWFANRRVWIPESDKRPGQFRTWAEPLVDQLCCYSGPGTTKHDDYLDTVTQFFRVVADQGMFNVQTEEQKRDHAIKIFRQQADQQEAPYG